MELEEVTKLSEFLHRKGKAGAAPLTIARETGITHVKVINYLTKYPQLFVRVGNSSAYTVSLTFITSGDRSSLLKSEFDKLSTNHRLLWIGTAIAIFSGLIASVLSAGI